MSRSGTIGLDEFVGLWGYLNQWRTLFTRFDADSSGYIDRKEFATALGQFGYRLSDGFVGVLFTSYDKKGNFPPPPKKPSFPSFLLVPV
jgi:peflin